MSDDQVIAEICRLLRAHSMIRTLHPTEIHDSDTAEMNVDDVLAKVRQAMLRDLLSGGGGA